MKILIVEDEEAIADGLRFNFEMEGYDAHVVGDGQSALQLLQSGDPPIDLVVLDLMLPGMSGYEVCAAIRDFNSTVPILILSARTLSEDKIRAFDSGSDQYMTKPFALPELLSRVRSLLERRKAWRLADQGMVTTRQSGPPSYRFGNIQVNFGTFQVVVGDKVQNLTTLEMQLLRYFIENEGKVLPRTQILNEVWEQQAEVTTRTIDNFVLRLRKVLEPDPARPQYIVSVRGTGYRFVASGTPQGDVG